MLKLLFVLCLFITSSCIKEEVTIKVQNTEKQYLYYYDKLNEEEKLQYDLIYEAVLKQDKSLVLEGINAKEVERLFSFVRNDHPSLFWLEHYYRYVTNTFSNKIEMKFNYNTKREDIEMVQNEIDAICDRFIASIDTRLPAIEIIRLVYDYLIETISYEEKSLHNQNIMSSLLYKKSVCAGYAKAFQYILLKLNIPCAYIEGNVVQDGKVRHAWNMVELENDYLYVDSTWGDQKGVFTHSCSAYFSMDEEEMLKLYTPDAYYENSEQISTSYFEKEGSYFYGWEEDKIVALWKRAILKGENYIEMKCVDKAYKEILFNIQNQGKMMALMRRVGIETDTLFYVENEALGMIEIFY